MAAALGYTKERAEQLAFTSAHYQVPIRVMVKTAAGINSFKDLEGKRVSAVTGATTELYAKRGLPNTQVVSFQTGPAAFLAFMQDKTDGFSTSHTAGLGFLRETNGQGKFINDSLAWEPTALGVKKGEAALLAAVNGALQAIEASGELDAMWNKWYGPASKFPFPREKKLTPIEAFMN